MVKSNLAIKAPIASSFTGRKRIRKSFGRIPEVAEMPNLIEVQRQSYDMFLQMDVLPSQRQRIGLQEVFTSIFPIKDFASAPFSISCAMNLKSRSMT